MESPPSVPEQELDLVSRCRQGDRLSFDKLWKKYSRRISYFIYIRAGANPEDTADLTQETFIRAWTALAKGTNVSAFRPWLYSIARNVAIDWLRGRKVNFVPLDEQLEHHSSKPSVVESVETSSSLEFLLRQLDEVLITSSENLVARNLGHLRKMAFMGFYVDGQTLPKLKDQLAAHAQALGVAAPSKTQLNNWLSRGDILNALVRHLVMEHPGWTTGLIKNCLETLSLPSADLDIALLRWHKGMEIQLIAAQTGLQVQDLANKLERIADKLTPLVTSTLKAGLHDSRRAS